jgi:hypothetical protein
VVLVLTTLVPVLVAVLTVFRWIVLALLLTVAVATIGLTRRRRRLVGCCSERSGAAEPEGRDHRSDHNESLHPKSSPFAAQAASRIYVSVRS